MSSVREFKKIVESYREVSDGVDTIKINDKSFKFFCDNGCTTFDLKSDTHHESLFLNKENKKAYIRSSQPFETPFSLSVLSDQSEFQYETELKYAYSAAKVISKRAVASLKRSIEHSKEIEFTFTGYLQDYLGMGSYASVWKHDGKAIKIHTLSRETEYSLIHEVAVLEKCDHPNVVRALEKGRVFKRHYAYTLELADMNLCSYLERSISDEVIGSVCHQISNGVAYLHSQNILHRDIGARNILVFLGSQMPIIKIGDFGTAVILQRKIIAKEACTTPKYDAPNYIDAPFGFELDVWSMGCVFFNCLYQGSDYNYKLPYDVVGENKLVKATFGMCLVESFQRATSSSIARFLTGEEYKEPVLEEGSDVVVEAIWRDMPTKKWKKFFPTAFEF